MGVAYVKTRAFRRQAVRARDMTDEMSCVKTKWFFKIGSF